MTDELAVRPRRGRRPKAVVQNSDAGSNADQSRLEVLQAAATAFMQNGYAATSIDTVAEVLGATKGRVYYYYRSKADLFFDVHREAMTLNLDIIRPLAASSAPPREKLRNMVIAHCNLVMQHYPFQRVSTQGVELHLTGATTPDQRRTLKALIEMRDEYERHFLTVLEQGIAAKDFRFSDPRIVVKAMLGSLNWMTLWYRPRSGETAETRQKIANEHAAFVLMGVAGHGGDEASAEIPPA